MVNGIHLLLISIAGYRLVSAICWNNSIHPDNENFSSQYISTFNDEFNPRKVLTGPLYQLGDYLDCVYKLGAKYCLAEVRLTKGNSSSPVWQRIQMLSSIRTNFRRDILNVGLCVPTQCGSFNVSRGLEDSLTQAAKKLGIAVSVSKENCQTKQSLTLNTADYVVACIIFSIIVIVLMGSTYDATKRIWKSEEPIKTTGERFLLCFSLLTNWQRLCTVKSTKESIPLQGIQGIRVISMYLILVGHYLFFTLNAPIKNPEWVEESYHDLPRSFIYNGHTVMGTFFCISGFLLGYFMLKELEVRGKFGVSGMFAAIFHRYVRLTPVYAIIVALAASWFNHLGSGPMWHDLVSTETENCQHHWWINLLYLNNYFYVDKPCLLHTWYLAADFQNYIVSILVLVPVWKYPRFAKTILTTVMIIWIVVPFVETYNKRLDPTLLMYPETVKHITQDKTFQKAYVTFHNNAGAYFVGVIFGYIYYNATVNGEKRTKLKYIVVWSISLTVPWVLLLLGFVFFQPSYSYNVLTASLYASVNKTLFAAGIGTIILGLALGYGWIAYTVSSWRPFQVLGRLMYAVYLIHFCVQRLEAGATKEPITLSEYSLAQSAHANLVMSYALALILCLFIEMPSSALPKIFYNSAQAPEENMQEEYNSSVKEEMYPSDTSTNTLHL